MPYRRFAVMGVGLILVATPVFGQATGSVTGVVGDETGGVLPGVTVEVTAGSEVGGAVTDEVGRYRVENLPAGPATVTFRLINFSTYRQEVTIGAGRPTTVDALLTLSLMADIVVTGAQTFRNIADLDRPAENLVRIANSSSVGAITATQLEARPIMRPAEVLEAVPGLIASQHSGEGKANQYYLRGFNLDHGSDFATTLAGVPLNVPSGAHFHGYTDTNLLIPELVSGLQFRKGPYFADTGDFSAAGSANINYVNALDAPLVSVSSGGQGFGRILTAASPAVATGHLLMALELNQNDGPWERPDDLRKANGVVRYSRGDRQNGFSVTGIGYSADWNATDQVPQRAIDSGRIGRFGAIDNTDVGRTFRYAVAVDGQRAAGSASTRVTGYLQRYGLNLIQNFTYFLDDPVGGDQFEQADRRTEAGARVTYRRLATVIGQAAESAVGAELRHTDAGLVALYATRAQVRTAAVREDAVRQTSLGLFGQSEIEWSPVFRTTVGLRGDIYDFSVDALNPRNGGGGTEGIISPKATAVLGPWHDTEFYLNWGYGFHSNDIRGATLTVDPATGAPVDRVTPLVRANGSEVGLRTVALPGVQSTLALWYLSFESELLFIGDTGTTEASRPSRRWGLEWANYARLAPWLTAEADLAFTDSRFTDNDPAGPFIPGALDRVVTGTLTVEPVQRLFGSLRVRHFGPRALTEDASVTSAPTTIWNLELGYSVTPRMRVFVEGFNLLDAEVSDIDYYYASRLPGDPASGIEDIHTHPSIPRTARIGVQVTF